ncbi:hypothetical protein DPMN_008603 [Dreissena polymorpha]|uniref:Uncharacterized protein n=1 Tax=Dreissena polymorpha TaxID=45954 RepID=A0A9D4MYQ5_DREPO|nr:hypothetical protein DPMN_008603 [Dreissena polymorpha]
MADGGTPNYEQGPYGDYETYERMKKVDDLMKQTITQPWKERDAKRDDSIRSNLMFLSVPEDNTADNETPDVTDRQLPKHLEDAFHIARKMVDPSEIGADQKKTTGNGQPELPAPGIKHENTSAPGTSEEGCEQDCHHGSKHCVTELQMESMASVQKYPGNFQINLTQLS